MPSATVRNSGPSGQLVGNWIRMRVACSMTRSNLDQALTNGRKLLLGERLCARNGGAPSMHQPERGGVEDEPHLIGRRWQ
jgi:hypothetical protein